MSNKNVLLLYPKLRDVNNIDVKSIINTLHNLEYKVFIKSRGKDRISNKSIFNDVVIHDEDWFPHPSIDLMYACNLAINFDSTAIKEAAVLKTPVINYHIKPKNHGAYARLNFLLNEDFIFHCEGTTDDLKKNIKKIETTDFTDCFDRLLNNKLFNRKNVCEKIISFIK